ncbi:hypothetical protein [Asticcacaulis sp. AND118]|uniref:hypothetical protein n=1 Tax=Asticcacaulis sp. AND118 TaxID=2840468 RepID=UPI001D0003EF|nr:hypothetical protein [Asticcacaulis sp. AND118]UDF04431.1 hypothetical protein LH365_05175 [Asticcacaulis sp. AND118]
MLLPESIDVAAGLVFIYLLMSVLATTAREALEGFCKSRARNLERGLIELLCNLPNGHKLRFDPKSGEKLHGFEFLEGFYNHPLIMTLYRGHYKPPPRRRFFEGRKLPSYIPAEHFAFVVLDMIGEKGGQVQAGRLDPQAVLDATNNLNNPRLAKVVQLAVNTADGDMNKARTFLEQWFNATMDRVSGWYRHETQTVIFWFSLVACVIMNVNTVVIADTLYRSPSLRKAVEASAQQYYTDTAVKGVETTASLDNPLSRLGLPLGWNATTMESMQHLFRFCGNDTPLHDNRKCPPSKEPSTPAPDFRADRPDQWWNNTQLAVGRMGEIVSNAYYGTPTLGDNALFNLLPLLALISGWVMTAFAVTLGAPFWFDILSKLMTVRSTFKGGAPPPGSNFTPLQPNPDEERMRVITLPASSAITTAASPALAAPVPVLVSEADDALPDPSLRPRDY